MDWGKERNEWRNALAVWRKPWTLRKLAVLAAAAAVIGLLVFWVVTIPASVPASALAPYKPDIENGKIIFEAGDCSSCHANPEGDRDAVDRHLLPGGLALHTPFGTLYAPNISPHPTDGIGSWTEANFVTALWDGTSPRGTHYYPALPYTSYQRMKLNDVRDLFAYIKTLPPVAGKARAHDMNFPFNFRRLVGGWKFLFLDGKRFVPDSTKSATWNRGAYLVNGPGHCAECHSPRNAFGAIKESQRFAGGPNPEPDKDWVPNITQKGLSHGPDDGKPWTESDLEGMLVDGSKPDGDYVGSQMADVVRNTTLLSKEDRAAIATYVLSLPPVDGPPRQPKKKKPS
jgi:mono/diheme cytochrome c family protein